MPTEDKKTQSIKGVEVFSVGKWNGDEYSHDDLNEMVMAFEENKSGTRPYIKLGHDSKQKLLQEDGLPAAGWIDKLYIKGDKLVADFVDIPSKIYALIKARAYRKVSSEIFWNITIGKKKYKRMLAAVALLGSDTPGVMNLNDILSMYKSDENNYEKLSTGDALDLKYYNESGAKMEKTELEVKLEQELAEQKQLAEKLETEKKEFALKQEEAAKELEQLREFKKEAELKEAELKAENEKIKIEKFVNELCADQLCTPAMKDLVTELVGPEKKEYSANKVTKEEALKEVLKLFKASKDVNLAEGSSKGDKNSKDIELEMDKKAKEYMEKNKCSYGQAIKAVMKDAK